MFSKDFTSFCYILLYFIFFLYFFFQNPLFLHSDFGTLSSNIHKISSVSPSANGPVFGHFDVHQKPWLNYFGGTNSAAKLFCNFCISKDLNQTVILNPGCNTNNPALSNLFLACNHRISVVSFPPSNNYDPDSHVGFFFAPFHCTAFIPVLTGIVFVIITSSIKYYLQSMCFYCWFQIL